MGYKLAVVGATGAVGREILKILAQKKFPVDSITALASPRSAGKEVSFGEKNLKVANLEKFDFKGTDIALFSPGSAVSAKYAPQAAKAGCIVIDNTSHFRMDPNVPLVVPEVNPQALKHIPRGIIANPNCSTIQMVAALKPLHDHFSIKRIIVSTYQAVSGAGKSGMNELYTQARGDFVGDPPTVSQFQKEIAFNCIPQIDHFMDDGSTKEEWKMQVETRKIMDPDIAVLACCVRVPVFIGHAESIAVECRKAVALDKARDVLEEAPGVMVVDRREEGGYVTPRETAGEDSVFVSRLRIDPTVSNGLALWCAADNLRKGAALNAVQIAQTLVNMKTS